MWAPELVNILPVFAGMVPTEYAPIEIPLYSPRIRGDGPRT